MQHSTSSVLGFAGGGAVVAAVVANQAINIQPLVDCISNLGGRRGRVAYGKTPVLFGFLVNG